MAEVTKKYEVEKLKTFRLNSGNINSCGELKLAKCKNSAEELLHALRIKLSRNDSLEFSNDEMVSLAPMDTKNYPRNDLKITLKVFMSTCDFQQVADCLNATKSELDVKSIEQLILAFDVGDDCQEGPLTEWLACVMKVWNKIEALVDDGLISTLGLADLDLPHLRALYDAASIKPSIAHFNIAGCCTVPKELQEYARSNDIQLLTHNDPSPFVTPEALSGILTDERYPMSNKHYLPTWSSRYTVWVRGRSIIASKGYMVQYERDY